MNTIVVPKLVHFLPSKKINMEPNFQHLELSDPYYYKPSPIDMIIGSDYLPLRCSFDYRKLPKARESHFGWDLSGPFTEVAINAYIFGTNTRNWARPRTYSKLWSAETRTNLDGPTDYYGLRTTTLFHDILILR